MNFKANITVVSFNRLSHTLQSIPSIRDTGDTDNIPFMITAIDNGSKDGSASALKAMYNKGIIDNLILLPENEGVSKACNLGWKLFETKAPYYAKIDNDIVFNKPNWLSPLIDTMEKCPEIGALGYNCEAKNHYAIIESNGTSYRHKGGNIGGACFFVPPQAHDVLGFWREDFDKYGEEDADMGVRVMIANLRNAYMPDEEVITHLHETDRSYREFKDQQRRDNLAGPFQEVHHGYYKGTHSVRVETNVHKDLTYEFYSHHFKLEDLI